MADLKPGEDGGSTGEGLPFALQRQVVFYRTTVVPGSIVVDRENRFLYLIDGNNSARRYGIGIAQECLNGGSLSRVTNKLEWPDWRPSGVNTKDADALLAAAGHPGSPLGARALLLDKPGLLIHGTNSPKTIGHLVASGCIRLVNDDVEDLYRRVSLETRVVFVSQEWMCIVLARIRQREGGVGRPGAGNAGFNRIGYRYRLLPPCSCARACRLVRCRRA